MINTKKIENMLSGLEEMIFVFPECIEDIEKNDVISYNRYRFMQEENGIFEFYHVYENIDLILSEYYLFCMGENKISNFDFLVLLKKMITEYESISFVSFFSEELQIYRLEKANEIFLYLVSLFKFCLSCNSSYNLIRYICCIFEENAEWNNGLFNDNILTKENQIMLIEIKKNYNKP